MKKIETSIPKRPVEGWGDGRRGTGPLKAIEHVPDSFYDIDRVVIRSGASTGRSGSASGGRRAGAGAQVPAEKAEMTRQSGSRSRPGAPALTPVVGHAGRVGGVIVQNATLHNRDEIARLPA
jgi:DNA ligase (NAD+)